VEFAKELLKRFQAVTESEYLEFSSDLPEYFKDFLRRYAQ
jgi:hypothetical protein